MLGKPILYKTTREFLIQFGLNSLTELPTLKEFEELGRFAWNDGEDPVTSASAKEKRPEEMPNAEREGQPQEVNA